MRLGQAEVSSSPSHGTECEKEAPEDNLGVFSDDLPDGCGMLFLDDTVDLQVRRDIFDLVIEDLLV